MCVLVYPLNIRSTQCLRNTAYDLQLRNETTINIHQYMKKIVCTMIKNLISHEKKQNRELKK